jgi:hypothetical protein
MIFEKKNIHLKQNVCFDSPTTFDEKHFSFWEEVSKQIL